MLSDELLEGTAADAEPRGYLLERVEGRPVGWRAPAPSRESREDRDAVVLQGGANGPLSGAFRGRDRGETPCVGHVRRKLEYRRLRPLDEASRPAVQMAYEDNESSGAPGRRPFRLRSVIPAKLEGSVPAIPKPAMNRLVLLPLPAEFRIVEIGRAIHRFDVGLAFGGPPIPARLPIQTRLVDLC
jgi:hypothetical protein